MMATHFEGFIPQGLRMRFYVLHCFQKKSQRGAETPRAELSLIEKRLKDAKEHYETKN